MKVFYQFADVRGHLRPQGFVSVSEIPRRESASEFHIMIQTKVMWTLQYNQRSKQTCCIYGNWDATHELSAKTATDDDGDVDDDDEDECDEDVNKNHVAYTTDAFAIKAKHHAAYETWTVAM